MRRAAVRRAAVRRACLDPDDVRFLHAGEAADLKARPIPTAWRTHCREQRCKGLRRRADGGKVQRPARDDAMQSIATRSSACRANGRHGAGTRQHTANHEGGRGVARRVRARFMVLYSTLRYSQGRGRTGFSGARVCARSRRLASWRRSRLSTGTCRRCGRQTTRTPASTPVSTAEYPCGTAPKWDCA